MEEELFGTWVWCNFMGVEGGNGLWLILRESNFIKSVLFKELKVQLFWTADVKTESLGHAFDFAFARLVSVIYGTCGSRLNDDVIFVPFIFGLPQV